MKSLCLLFLFVVQIFGKQSVVEVFVSEQNDREALNASSGEGQFSLKTLFDGPVVVLTTLATGKTYEVSQNDRTIGLRAYYADKGLSKIAEYANFQPLHETLLSTPHVTGLVYSSNGFNSPHLLKSVIDGVVYPDGFRIIDFLQAIRDGNIHILYLAPKDFFVRLGFPTVKSVGTFLVDEFSVELLTYNNRSLPDKPSQHEQSSLEQLNITSQHEQSSQEQLNTPSQHPQSSYQSLNIPSQHPQSSYPSLNIQSLRPQSSYPSLNIHSQHPQSSHQPLNIPSGFIYPFAPSYYVDNELYRRYRQVSPFFFGSSKNN